MREEGKTKEQLIHELEALRREYAGLKKLEEGRKRAEDGLSIITDTLNTSISGIIITDTDGKITYANPAFLRMFEYHGQDEIKGKYAKDLFATESVQKFSDVTTIIDQTKGETEEFPARRKDGTIFPVEVTSSIVTGRDGNNVGRMTSFVDITEHTRAETALQQSEKELTIRTRIAEIFLTTPDEQMYYQILELVLEVMESEFGVFGYLDEKGDLVVPTMTRHIWDQCEVEDKDILFPRETWGDGTWPRAIREKRTIYSNEPSTNTPKGHIGVTRHISLPLIHREVVIGLMQVANKKIDYSEWDLKLFETIGNAIAPILAARLQRDREERERRQVEAALQESDEKFRTISNNAADAILITDEKGKFVYSNNAASELLAYTSEEFLDIGIIDLANKYHGAKFMELFDVLLQTGKLSMEMEFQTKDGTVVPVELNSVVLPNGLIYGSFRDISERKRAKEELIKQRDHLEEMVAEREILHHDLSERVKELDCLYGMATLVETPGNSIEDIIQGTVELIPKAFQHPEVTCARIILDGQEYRSPGKFMESGWELSYDISTGGERSGTVTVFLLEEKHTGEEGLFLNGERTLIRLIAERLGHVIGRKEAEDKLSLVNDALNTSISGIIITDTDGMITYANPSFLKMFEYHGQDEIKDKYAKDLFATERVQKFSDVAAIIDQTKGETEEFPARRKDGTIFPVEVTSSIVTDSLGNNVGRMASFVDITERKLQEEEILKHRDHLEKMVAERTAELEKTNEHLAEEAAERKKAMVELREKTVMLQRQDWIKTGIVRLGEVLSGDPDIETLANKAISEIAGYVDVQIGAIYVAQPGETPVLSLMGSFAYKKHKNMATSFKLGEGLVGQAALEKKQIVVKNVPKNYIKVSSGLGERVPSFICVTPFLHEGRVKGVVEIGTLGEISDLQTEYLAEAMPALAIAVESAESRMNLARLLQESQALSDELQTQQEEIEASNEELEEQTQALQQSEERLKAQQEELQVTNEELEEKNEMLERQTREVEEARKNIQEKAEEVAIASKYKSQFLANMSHELRTPLNSLLLLSRMLAENKEGNLTEEQSESAGIIYAGGKDLLSLINEILDLAKIESGQMNIHIEKVIITELAGNMESTFRHLAGEKALKFEVNIHEDAPGFITTDMKRLEQILRNLLSNAVKFTEKGSVTVEFQKPTGDLTFFSSDFRTDDIIAISIKDTGIGIPREMQKIIFEAFQQVDGSISRRFGGTGLGLSISRELVTILGGEIRVISEVGRGSDFTVYLPVKGPDVEKSHHPRRSQPEVRIQKPDVGLETKDIPVLSPVKVADDRDCLESGETVILVIEDDATFAKLLVDQCRQKGFKCVVAATGEDGIVLADKFLPSAIILDIQLPGMNGMEVLNILKDTTRTRHIPVHILSVEDPSFDAFHKGAIGFMQKPVTMEELDGVFSKLGDMFSRKVKNVLLVEDNKGQRLGIRQLIGNGDVHMDEAENAKAAHKALRSKKYDCMILDLMLPDISGFQLLNNLQDEAIEIPPVIVYTAKDLSREEELKLREYAESIIIKGVHSEERLLDETALFLHRMVGKLPKKKRKIIADLHDMDVMFKGKKVLVVDDDMRTLFAMSKTLHDRGITALKAEDGTKALELLEEEPNIDLILMDIMMPGMDGYETMKHIRKMDKWARVPIIAVTAKAMKGDAERCIEGGANDYLPKPVDLKRLFSMLRVWLYR